MASAASSSRPRAGRPTREQAQARHEELLDSALDHFLDKGYELATIEAIAAGVGMTKRTVYARYEDKAALFCAVVTRAIEKFAPSQEEIAATQTDDLEQTLVNIAMLRIDLVATARGQKLQRIVNTESYRFPEIFSETYVRGTLDTVKFLARVLERKTTEGEVAIDDPMLAANTFMSMVVGGPVRFITGGMPLDRAELDRRVRFAVRLFLNGARPR